MSKTKICKKCNRELPRTEEYFYKVKNNKDGLHGTCRECRKEQANVSASKRRNKGKHLIHDLVCDWCGINFKGDTNKRRFCSRDCQYDWQRNSQEYKEIHKDNINQHGTIMERERRFKNDFEDKFPLFEYHSGFISREEIFKMRCRVCGSIQERNAQCTKPSNNKLLECDNCISIEKIELERLKSIKKIKEEAQKKEEKMLQEKINIEIKALERIKRNHEHYIECSECGKKFFSSKEKLTCSSKCANKRSRRHKEIERRRRLKDNGKIDWNITLDKLIKRDNNKCHICGGKCDKSDYVLDNDKDFIVGTNYPSIDHVIPVIKGGTHTWDNIKLAHHYCNTIKNDNVVYEGIDGQLTIAM